ncbi:MAG: ABC transporter permease [Desulfobulbaceae bacterium]|nr:ABC transporter permease [Desulfobacteraceae bacterium]MDH3542634.1 ABC transporter permease [Desulfobulbaceae bacterium]
MIDFLIEKSPELLIKFREHVVLTGVSTSFAILAGVPLGILITRHKTIRGTVLAVAGVVQTIPSLAMLAFLLPILGIGIKPAIVALTLYAFLPIIRNTYTGLTNISDEIIEAATGVGFTPMQMLCLVELPLAMPVIFAGIRTAAVIGVGIATLSSFIGAGGLGDFINRGLALNNTNLIFLGAGTAAILALTIDFFLGFVESLIWKRK